jgi:diketogulonate reductase-like aldo/keto reductase
MSTSESSGSGSRSLADTVDIANGVAMPRLGLGTYKSTPGDETRVAVLAALQLGYRAIDTAALYGNEQSVGQAIRDSGIPREEIFVTTKVWDSDQGFDSTLAAFERSTGQLGLGYVDLYLVHWPVRGMGRATWRAMEQLLARRCVRAIGVCNHLVHHLEELLDFAKVPPSVNQVEFHPRLQQPELQEFCASEGIRLEAWAPIMRGGVFHIPELLEVAERHHKTAAQVTVRWILQKDIVAIPKSIHAERIAENANVFDFALDSNEMALMDSLDRGERIGPHPDERG